MINEISITIANYGSSMIYQPTFFLENNIDPFIF